LWEVESIGLEMEKPGSVVVLKHRKQFSVGGRAPRIFQGQMRIIGLQAQRTCAPRLENRSIAEG